MQSAVESAIGLPSRSTRASSMLWLVTPPDVRSSFKMPPSSGTRALTLATPGWPRKPLGGRHNANDADATRADALARRRAAPGTPRLLRVCRWRVFEVLRRQPRAGGRRDVASALQLRADRLSTRLGLAHRRCRLAEGCANVHGPDRGEAWQGVRGQALAGRSEA